MPHPEDEIRRAVAMLVADEGQAAVADAIGVAQSTVSRYLLGQRRLTMRLAAGLIAAYPHLRATIHAALDAGDAGEREEVLPIGQKA